MLFIGGLTHKEERLEMPQPLDCEACAQKGQYELWMSAWSLTLFFIPVLKWGRSYRLYSPCCRRWHCLERKVGQELAQGLKKSLDPQDLLVGEASNEQRRCSQCGKELKEEFGFCPYCGDQQER